MRSFATAVVLTLVACASGDDIDSTRPRDGARVDGGSSRDGGVDAGPDDAGERCEDGTRITCRAACGSTGSRQCEGGAFGDCEPPFEDCNGADDDCDGDVDEVGGRMCASECGGGVERCEGGTWSGCSADMPGDETCDGRDEDCDSRVDEGLSRACSSACGAGTETCMAGAWVDCTAPPVPVETCDDRDEDCDGRTDEGVTRTCSSACGAGTEACSAGVFGACSARVPAPETCNSMDDDCDGDTDEGADVVDGVPMAALTAAQPTCTAPSSRLDVCMSAATRWCAMQPCHRSGVGFLQASASSARVACFRDATAIVTTFAEVSMGASVPITSDNVHQRVAQSAVSRFCRRMGHAAGVGPVEHSFPRMDVLCLSDEVATTLSVPTSAMRARGCDPVMDADDRDCSYAADDECRARGHAGGYGPVEWNPTTSTVNCFID